MRILGIDPGLNATGYGIIEQRGGELSLVAAGDIRPSARWTLARRVLRLHEALTEIVEAHEPELTVLEALFTHHQFVTTAALMAHARGIALLVSAQHGLSVVEYLPKRVKKSVAGHGAASKDQVARAVATWLGLRSEGVAAGWSADTTDALALAIGHAHMGEAPAVLTRRGGLSSRNLAPELAAVLAHAQAKAMR